MTKYDQIKTKLQRFVSKYYRNELLKGAILFFAIGICYFLLTVSFELFFWLSKTGRLVMFCLFILVELALFSRFIIFPILKLCKLSKGISDEEAAKIIGAHFPEIGDKLLNVLQLHRTASSSDSVLLLASIDKKADDLEPIPFRLAVDFKSNIKFLKFAIIPLLIILAIWISGQSARFTASYSRVINYEKTYEPPAPFQFFITNTKLKTQQKESFVLQLQTRGDLVPENVKIHFHNQAFVLESTATGKFTFTFENPEDDIDFYFTANGITSEHYKLTIVNVPVVLEFKMNLDYPDYLQRKKTTITGSGNAIIPEGTRVHWVIETNFTDQLSFIATDSIRYFLKTDQVFTLDSTVTKSFNYAIATSNSAISDYETLSYRLKVIADDFPDIAVKMKRDTVSNEHLFFKGKVSDDHGLTSLRLVYYPSNAEKEKKFVKIPIQNSAFDSFLFAFPNQLDLKPGITYNLFFQVFDNDEVNGFKSKKSTIFSYHKKTMLEKREQDLNAQGKTVKNIDKQLRNFKRDQADLEKLQHMQKEDSKLSYRDSKKLKEFYKRQLEANEQLKNYAEKMHDMLKRFQDPQAEDSFKRELEKRYKKRQEGFQKNKKLLKELMKFQHKLSDEKLAENLDKFSRQKQNQHRSLKKLLELTKRYFVRQKSSQIAEKLAHLAKRQDKLSKTNDSEESKIQDSLNTRFSQLKKALDSLSKTNQSLKDPIDFGRKKALEENVTKSQNTALQKLSEQEKNKELSPKSKSKNSVSSQQKLNDEIKYNQKNAAKKMQEMSRSMQMKMRASMANKLKADAKMLRQILGNLIIFSEEQEQLMLQFKDLDKNSPVYGKYLREQQHLRENFGFIDDSLFVLAMRNPMISGKITSEIVAIKSNLDASLERLSQSNIQHGVASQHYVLRDANGLANMLDDALQNMQMKMKRQGSGIGKPKPGKGRGFQLKDIIKKQGELKSRLEKGKKEGQKPGDKPGQKSGQKPGQKAGQGKPGSKGEKGRGRGQGSSEKMSARLYQIYKEQQKLRFQLHNFIEQQELNTEAKRLEKLMKNTEQELLQSGFSGQSEQMMTRIKERMLRLKNASYKQSMTNQRQSKTSYKQDNDGFKAPLEQAKDYFNTTELLNRHHLPLQPDYKILIKDYFTQDHD